MERLVYSCFKAVMVSMILVFVADIGMYIFRCMSLNSRMESLAVSMQNVIMENNYLPSGSHDTYTTLMQAIKTTMNGGEDNEDFIVSFSDNYDTDAVDCIASLKVAEQGSATKTDVLVKQTSEPAKYGDVMVLQLSVKVHQPMWYFTSNTQSAESWDRDADWATTEFYYTYYVPCLQYRKMD